MKKLLYAIAALSVLAVGCSDDPEEVLLPEVPADPVYATVELSSTQAVFPVAGASKSIFVATNNQPWKAQCDDTWLTLAVDGNQITLTAGENPDAASRTAVVIVKSGEELNTAAARFKVIQAGNATVDLSAVETANCYIAAPNGSYRFAASVKGNGKGDGNSCYIANHGLEIEGASYADLAWEATYDGDRTRSSHIIEGSPVYSAEEQAIYFNTGAQEGNALIAVCAPDGEILWSWHIWVVADTPATSSYGGVTWMDRNLGALNNTPGDIANRGMFYQWGRKDPFLPSKGAYMDGFLVHDIFNETLEETNAIEAYNNELRPLANIVNTQIGDGSCAWSHTERLAFFVTELPGNIDFTVKHPTTFLQRAALNYDVPNDWFLGSDVQNGPGGAFSQSSSALWGLAISEDAGGNRTPTHGYKSIFDPCPAGYVVPTQNSFGSTGDKYFVGVETEWTKDEYGFRWTGGTGDYFPLTGYYYSNGRLFYASEDMGYWTAMYMHDPNVGGKSACLFFDSFYQYLKFGIEYFNYPWDDFFSMGTRAFGMPIRCVKE